MYNLDETHQIADRFLRDYIDSQNPQILAEPIYGKLHVNFIRPDGKYFIGVKNTGQIVWSDYKQFATNVPENVMNHFISRLGPEALPMWAIL